MKIPPNDPGPIRFSTITLVLDHATGQLVVKNEGPVAQDGILFYRMLGEAGVAQQMRAQQKRPLVEIPGLVGRA